ncbi:MAG: hypothetical protein L0H96_21205 [Humibacillus sp.]|nr:hypothetical protein [Humibacillus sp.]MDN5779416.1 hypothetical protein [Humibacillus sp.]
MNERDLDAEFERIIAGWDDVAPDPTFDIRPADDSETGLEAGPAVAPEATHEAVPETASEPTPDAGPDPGEPPEPPGPPRLPGKTGPSHPGNVFELPIAPGAGHTWRGTARPHDDDDVALSAVPSDDPDGDHFIPPTEMDLPTAEDDPMFWAIVIGLAGGPLLLLYLLFFDRDGSGWWIVTSLSMIGVGFILLVLRGGTERDPTDDGTRV